MHNPHTCIPGHFFMCFQTLAFILVSVLHVYCTETTVTIRSKTMQNPVHISVFSPERRENDSLTTYPSVYLLHGYNGNHETWKRVAPLSKLSEKYKLIFICPDAQNSWYLDSPHQKQSAFETFFIKELLPFIDSTFTTINNRNSRALCGISMGGHGSLTMIAKYPDLFCTATSLCGILDLKEFPDQWGLNSILGTYENNKGHWNNNSFTTLLKLLIGKRCVIALDCGISDFALPGNRKAHQQLLEYGIDHEYYERPGKHTIDYPVRNFEFHLLFISQNIQKR